MNWKNILIGFGAAAFFSLLLMLGLFAKFENQIYDYFLGFRAERSHTSDVVFLDVDDNAIAVNGVFPWPRSVTADSLLRLKEFGARAAVFDIEFIDKGPQGVDTIYLNQGLPADFNRTFSDIVSASNEFSDAIKTGRLSRNDIDEYSQELSNFIANEKDGLYSRAQTIARDNDQYLVRASALYGKSWVTLNLRSDPLTGEQAERRSIAEERFAYPVKASANASPGDFIDILPPLPGFAQAAKGAGFTNVTIDNDGIRRRIYLAQKIFGHWYLQLAFAPLVNFLGNPDIELDNSRMVLKNAKMPDGAVKDIAIPLDGQGRMMLDWPKTDYFESYKHVSYVYLSNLELIEAEMEKYARAFSSANIPFFDQFDSSLTRVTILSNNLEKIFDDAASAKAAALENSSDGSFNDYLGDLGQSRSLMHELLDIDPAAKINAMLPDLIDRFPGDADAIRDEAKYITALADNLKTNLDDYEKLSATIQDEVKDKFCILGRVDTGTTDIGANPFYGKYVNVGTHGVVIDMILSNSFISYPDKLWQMLFALIFVPLFFLVSAKLAPVSRALIGFVTAALLIAASILLFRFAGIFIGPQTPVLAIISAAIIREIVSYAGSEQEKQFIRKAFSTYVSDAVVKELIADPSRLQLGGTMRHMSAIFTDLQGFSSISEKLDPEKLVSLLNNYLTAMSDVVLSEMGTIDKYEGDAIIAFFGAPVDIPDHAVRACVSAITMKRLERELNKTLMAQKQSPSPLLTRIGINTGSMVAGNMGTGNKMNYTIMGNAVNLAARLEGVNKQYGTWIIAADDTVRETGGKILTRRLDKVRVIGINEAVRIHELLDTMEDAGEEMKKLVEVFHQAQEFYENRNWKAAAEGFRESYKLESKGPSSICPSSVYFERSKKFLSNPPDETWDGVFNLTEK